jgi:hypothetical protein
MMRGWAYLRPRRPRNCSAREGAGQDAFSTGFLCGAAPTASGACARPSQTMAQAAPASRFRLAAARGPGGFPTDPPTRYPPGMSNRPRSQTGPPMTLGNMRANGVGSIAVSCWQCHRQAVLSADRWPDHMALPTLGPRMVFTRGGIVGEDARPNCERSSQGLTVEQRRVLQRTGAPSPRCGRTASP